MDLRIIRAVAFGLVVLALAGRCGRRTERAFYDATSETSTAPPVVKPAVGLLPDSAIRVKWGETSMPATVAPGSSTLVAVTFTNEGDTPWPDKATADPIKQDGTDAVRLGYSWSDPDTGFIREDRTSARAEIPHSMKPGETVTLAMRIQAPEKPGDYVLTFDLVQELRFWFSDQGASPLTVPVKVAVGPA